MLDLVMHAGVIQYVLLFFATPYSFDSSYKDNEGLVELPKNKTLYCKYAFEEKFQDTKKRHGVAKLKTDDTIYIWKKTNEQTMIKKISHRNIRSLFYYTFESSYVDL